MLVLAVITACKEKKPDQAAVSGDGSSLSEVLANDSSGLITEVSELDCALYTVITKALSSDDPGKDQDEIRQLRGKKMELIKRLSEMFPDSASQEAVQAELWRRKQQEGYCPGLQALKSTHEQVSRNGVPKKQLHILEDAQKLARLNCEILGAQKRSEKDPGKQSLKQEANRLKDAKRALLHQLMLRYGNDIIRDPSFRTMVMEAQDAHCNFSSSVKASDKFAYFAP